MDDVTDVEVNDTVGSLSCVGDTFGSRNLKKAVDQHNAGQCTDLVKVSGYCIGL